MKKFLLILILIITNGCTNNYIDEKFKSDIISQKEDKIILYKKEINNIDKKLYLLFLTENWKIIDNKYNKNYKYILKYDLEKKDTDYDYYYVYNIYIYNKNNYNKVVFYLHGSLDKLDNIIEIVKKELIKLREKIN